MSARIEQRGSAWRVRTDATDPITGKRRQLSRTIPPGPDGKPLGRREAQRVADAWVNEVRAGAVSASDKTLDNLIDAYLAARPKMSIGTKDDTPKWIARMVPEHLRSMQIKRIDAYVLDQLYLRLLATGGSCNRWAKCDETPCRHGDVCTLPGKCEVLPCDHGGGQPLADSYVLRLHDIFSAAFGQAVKWGWLAESPTDRCTPPEPDPVEVEPPDVDEVLRLLDHVESLDPAASALPDFVAMLLASGARPGELCASRIGDLNTATARLTIEHNFSRGGGGTIKKTKTRRKRRFKIGAPAMEILAARRARLAPLALAGGTPIEEMFWFPSPGTPDRPIWPTSIGKEFRLARDAAGCSDRVTLRNLRHFVGSLLVAGGVDVRTASGRLGHGPQVLLNIYAHVVDEADDTAADVVELALERARRRAEDAVSRTDDVGPA